MPRNVVFLSALAAALLTAGCASTSEPQDSSARYCEELLVNESPLHGRLCSSNTAWLPDAEPEEQGMADGDESEEKDPGLLGHIVIGVWDIALSELFDRDVSEPMSFGCPFDQTQECQEALRQPNKPW